MYVFEPAAVAVPSTYEFTQCEYGERKRTSSSDAGGISGFIQVVVGVGLDGFCTGPELDEFHAENLAQDLLCYYEHGIEGTSVRAQNCFSSCLSGVQHCRHGEKATHFSS